MADFTQLSRIEQSLAEVDEGLRSAAPSPAVRELRVRHGALSRVVRGWVHVPPHDAQIAAMLECVLDLLGQVTRACGSPGGANPAMGRRTSRPPRPGGNGGKTTRPPPRRDALGKTTRPPPPKRRSGAPPSSGGT